MNHDPRPALGPDLLADFYAECEELLVRIRDDLSLLSRSDGPPAQSRTAAASLARGMHTLKGNCGIAGLHVGEQLAHALEDALRDRDAQGLAANASLIDALHFAVRRFEEVVEAHRTAQPLPPIDDVLRELRTASPASAPRASAAPTAAPTGDGPRWRCRFTPSTELDRRGVNIAAVRHRLAALGRIIDASPEMLPGGSIAFLFTLEPGSPPAAETVAALRQDGISLTPLAADEVPPPEPTHLEASHLVRVDLARLDDLMRITGELVMHRFRLEEQLTQRADVTALKEISHVMNRSLRALRQAVARVRMVPIGEVFSRMPFAARDLARGSGKQLRLTSAGDDTEVDKYLVERLKEPLLHLMRNAFAHGIETPQERSEAGKRPEGLIELRAASAGQQVEIRMRDDGRGIDFAEVARRAADRGIAVPAALDAASVLKLLCHPGFSTRDEVDLAAGRGVGMAVVADTVRELGGTLSMQTALGNGTTFVLRLPVTLSIIDALIVSAGDQTCAVPRTFIDELIEVQRDAVHAINTTEVVPYRDGLLPVVHLRSWYRLPPAGAGKLIVLVLRDDRGAVGLAVDRALTQREIVVRPLQDPLVRVPGFSGATELGDGRPILIVDPVALTKGAVRPPETSIAAS